MNIMYSGNISFPYIFKLLLDFFFFCFSYYLGHLHAGILIENMRREGFELSVSPPKVM